MSNRPTDWMPLNCWWDPVPGDPSVIRSSARQFQETADAIEQAHRNLLEISLHGKGEAIDKIRDKCEELAVSVNKAHRICDGVDDALNPYADALEDAQSESLVALDRAREGQHAYDNAVKHQNTIRWRYLGTTDPKERNRLEAEYYRWESMADNAHAEVAQARNILQNAIENRDEAANRAAQKLDDLVDNCDLKDNLWDKICGIARAIADFCEDILPILKAIGTILAIIGLVVMIFIPGGQIALIVAIASLAVSSAILVAEAAKDARDVADGKATWGDFLKHLGSNAVQVVVDALGVGAAATALRAAKTGGQAATVAGKAASSGSKTATVTSKLDKAVEPAEGVEKVIEKVKGGAETVKNVIDDGVVETAVKKGVNHFTGKGAERLSQMTYEGLKQAGATGRGGATLYRAGKEITKQAFGDLTDLGYDWATGNYKSNKDYFLLQKGWTAVRVLQGDPSAKARQDVS